MRFGEAVRTCLRKYATFSGRASRPEYWWFVLFVFIGEILTGLVDAVALPPECAIFSPLFVFAMASPGLAAGWRRMHDTGRSGLYLLYPLIVTFGVGSFAVFAMGIPEGRMQDVSILVLAFAGFVLMISPLLVLWWLTRPSEPRENPFGPPPPEVTP